MASAVSTAGTAEWATDFNLIFCSTESERRLSKWTFRSSTANLIWISMDMARTVARHARNAITIKLMHFAIDAGPPIVVF